MTSVLALVLAVFAVPLTATQTDETPAPSPAGAYRTFRDHFNAGRYAEALPAAQQVVELSEQKYGPEQMELVIPLTNLGATQLRLQSYFDAEESFKRALKVVEARQGGFSSDVIRPLLGLGATYATAGQHEEAVEQLRRALDVSRKVDGLFNPDQIAILEPLISSYVALGDEQEAERERDYAIRVAEVAYGKDDLRMLPALYRGAHWYEEVERYYAARLLYARTIGIIVKSAGEKKHREVKDVRMVKGLRGIAHTYRLEYLYGGKVMTEYEPLDGPVITNRTANDQRMADEGRRALESALDILKTAPDATPGQRGEVLLDLGDWYWTTGSKDKAFEYYKDAWQALSEGDQPGTAPMEKPVRVFYREPTGAKRRPPMPPEEYERQYVEVEFTVTAAGEVTNATVADTDSTDKRSDSVLDAIKGARYRPRFAAGESVATDNVRYRQDLYFKRKNKD